MPAVRTSSELQRNISAIYDLYDRTGEPVYITRNGASSLVAMDADSFEGLIDRQTELEHELSVYKALMQSEIDRLEGKISSWDDVVHQRASLKIDVA